jgi:hypothetical protein
MDASNLLAGAEWVVAAIAAIGACAMAIKKVYRLARNVEESLDTIHSVRQQFEPNGGNSMYDKLALLMQKVTDTAHKSDVVDGKITELSGRIQRLESFHMGTKDSEA